MIVAIVQARLGSTRLPGKALMDIAGETMLARTVNRARRAKTLDNVAVATTTLSADDRILEEARRLGVPCVRGSETDVLERYVLAAQELKADIIVRLTSDCPLIDPQVMDRVVEAFTQSVPAVSYTSNTLTRTYPRGLDVEVFSRAALEDAAREAALPHEREHVTPHFYEHPDRFRLLPVAGERDYSDLRWTVDTQADMDFVRAVYARLGAHGGFGWGDVVALLEREPELARINAGVKQKPFRGTP